MENGYSDYPTKLVTDRASDALSLTQLERNVRALRKSRRLSATLSMRHAADVANLAMMVADHAGAFGDAR